MIYPSLKRLTKFEIHKAKSKIKIYFIYKENKPNNLYLCRSNFSVCDSLPLSICSLQTNTGQNNSHLERVQQGQRETERGPFSCFLFVGTF